tara:strand:+ start:131 stop:790 length:660 start_codon:yes stop_codon:yes gene_type:complete
MTLTTQQQPAQPVVQSTWQQTDVATIFSWIWWFFLMYMSYSLFFIPHMVYYSWQQFKKYSIEAAKEAAKWDITITLSLDRQVRTTKKRNRETGQIISYEELVEVVNQNVRLTGKKTVAAKKIPYSKGMKVDTKKTSNGTTYSKGVNVSKKIPYSKGMTVYYTKEGNTDTVQIIKVHLANNSLSVIITDSYEKKRIGLELDVNMLSGRISLNKTLNKKER